MKEKITIRPLKKTEMDDLIQLCHAHAIFEGAVYSSEGKAKKLTTCVLVLNTDKLPKNATGERKKTSLIS